MTSASSSFALLPSWEVPHHKYPTNTKDTSTPHPFPLPSHSLLSSPHFLSPRAMYSHTFPRPDYLHVDSAADSSSMTYPFAPPPYLTIPHDQHVGLEVGSTSCSTTSTTSGCSSYGSPSSLASCATQRTSHYLQRSVSSHSLQKNGYHCHFPSPHDFLDHLDSSSSVRRVFSTGDLQRGGHHKAESPLSSESSMIIESMSKACKYSPEEKKERIERYRSKRNQRNFTKKIKYECRKTLADSRPRIRGRFARNDEIDHKNPDDEQLQWSNNMISGEEDELEDEDNWINFLDAFSVSVIP